MKIDNYRAFAVAINSLRYNPNLSDVEIQSYEIALAEIRDYMAQQEAEKSKPQYAERVKLYDDIRCDRLMTTCSWCYGRVGPHDKFCKHCGREFRDNSTSSKEALNA